MEISLAVWVLFALGLGWLMGSGGFRRLVRRNSKGMPPGYAEGLNFLLNKQPDRAIDLLISMVEMDSETVETHLALGTLFRNQGEVERAIRIHENLIARPALKRGERFQALMNLGLDYQQAGLNDRAVEIFEQLVDESPNHRQPAVDSLLEVYQHEKEWQKALVVLQRWARSGDERTKRLSGHFYCEIAELQIAANDLRGATRSLRHAGTQVPYSPRYLWMQTRLARLRGKTRAALRWINLLIDNCPRHRELVLEELERCYLDGSGPQQFAEKLEQLVTDPQSPPLLVCQALETIERVSGREAAITALGDRATEDDLALVIRLKQSLLLAADKGAEEEVNFYLLLREAYQSLAEQLGGYHCTHCGFEAREYFWRCPGCGEWDSLS